MLDRLTSLGIDLTGVRRLDGPGVRTWLLYEDGARQLVHRLGCPTHEDVSPGPAEIPLGWRTAGAFHLAPMPFSAQQALVTALASDADRFVSIDPHLPVTEETLPRWRRLLAGADAFFPGEDEMRLDGWTTDVRAVLPRLVCGRLRFVVLTRGARGGVLYDAREGRCHEWTARVDRVVDPTGAGDSFAAGFVTAHLDGLAVEACVQRGHVAASYALEAWGPAKMMTTTPQQAARRLRKWRPSIVSTPG
jgi:sugar/nucleoside kinase (ribokinase family)